MPFCFSFWWDVDVVLRHYGRNIDQEIFRIGCSRNRPKIYGVTGGRIKLHNVQLKDWHSPPNDTRVIDQAT